MSHDISIDTQIEKAKRLVDDRKGHYRRAVEKAAKNAASDDEYASALEKYAHKDAELEAIMATLRFVKFWRDEIRRSLPVWKALRERRKDDDLAALLESDPLAKDLIDTFPGATARISGK